jgi:hypothetical protein
VSTTTGNVTLFRSYPSSATQWTAGAAETNTTGGSWTVTVYVICG